MTGIPYLTKHEDGTSVYGRCPECETYFSAAARDGDPFKAVDRLYAEHYEAKHDQCLYEAALAIYPDASPMWAGAADPDSVYLVRDGIVYAVTSWTSPDEYEIGTYTAEAYANGDESLAYVVVEHDIAAALAGLEDAIARQEHFCTNLSDQLDACGECAGCLEQVERIESMLAQADEPVTVLVHLNMPIRAHSPEHAVAQAVDMLPEHLRTHVALVDVI